MRWGVVTFPGSNDDHDTVYALDHTLGLRVAIRLVKPQTIQRSEGKAKRVIDRRNLV